MAIRSGDWKLDPGKKQLFNLKDDPGETKNLEESHPEKIKELVDELAKAIGDGRTTPGEKQSNEGWPKRPSKGILTKYPQLGGK